MFLHVSVILFTGGGGFYQGDPLDRGNLWTETPQTETPKPQTEIPIRWTETHLPGQRSPDRDSHWTETPTGQRPPLDRDPLWTEGQRSPSYRTERQRVSPGQRPPRQRTPWTETPSRQTPPYGNERAVRILLECILVYVLNHLTKQMISNKIKFTLKIAASGNVRNGAVG